ncbi:MAG: ATP-binding protein [Rhodoferax sp.]|nr:ATP-binding protein [Rhodoferax sp.]
MSPLKNCFVGDTRLTRSRDAIRRQAEVLALEKAIPSLPPIETISIEETRRMLHELHVHQIELEMQNEELRRVQIALDTERARYFDLYDLAPAGYCTVSETGRIQQTNLTAATVLGVPRGALINQQFSQRILWADQDIYYVHRKKLQQTGEPQSCELHMVRRDGTPFWAQLACTAARDESGAAVTRIMFSDISERKQTEETARMNQSLLKSEALSRAIMDSVDVEIAVLDRNGVIVALNQPWQRFALANGITPGQAASHTDVGANYLAVCQASADAAADDDRLTICKGIRAVLDGSSPRFTREYRCDSPKQAQWFSMNVTPLGPDRQGVVISHNNITERMRAKDELLAAKAAADAANNAKSRFLMAASHDLRQPLSALSLYIGVLKGRTTPENGDLVAKIQACCDSLTELLNDLLDMSKLDAGVVTPKLSDFAIDDFLSALVSVHSAEAAIKGLRLHLRPCRAVVGHTDQHLLNRVVGNLLANAIRYTNTGGVLIACRRRAGVQWIEVWDTGLGIPEDKTQHIFEEFTQLGDVARNRGSGLGLAIVAKTAALLGLTIRLRSRPGRGSMFAIELPAGRVIQPAEPRALLTEARPLRIGLVEDHTEVRRALVLALQNIGHEVIAAANGKSLLKHLGERAPDIVISDFRLGAGETGFQVIEAARGAFGANLPAIIVTGDTDPTLIRSMTDRGVLLHFKPLQMDTLQAFIRQATERRSS